MITLLFTFLSGCFYRMGGMGKDGRKDYFPNAPKWLFSKKIRRGFCPSLDILWMIILYPRVPWWVHIVSLGLVLLGVTSYFDSTFFNWIKPKDNFYLHGFFIALGCILYPIFTGMWLGFILRCIILGLLMGLLSFHWADPIVTLLKNKLSKYPKLYVKVEKYLKNDWVQELGRGALMPITKILMLIK